MYADMIKVPITSRKTAIFICPLCKTQKIVDVSKYLKFEKAIKVNVSCSCGNKYESILEKRKQYRRKTNLSGNYILIKDSKITSRGFLTVCDISIAGMKLKLSMDRDISVGDILKVVFHLDDAHRSFIEKNVKVISKNQLYLGTEFLPTEDIGKALGFYLFTN